MGRRNRLSPEWADRTGASGELVCARCGEDMINRRDMVKTSRGRWVHRGCAAGGDDQ